MHIIKHQRQEQKKIDVANRPAALINLIMEILPTDLFMLMFMLNERARSSHSFIEIALGRLEKSNET